MAVQVIWALPFACLIILTVMANFDDAHREAVQVGGKLDDGSFQDRRLNALRITRIVGDEAAAF